MPICLQVVLAFHSVGCFPHFLDGRKQQANQDGNNGDRYQQLDQSKSAMAYGEPASAGGRRICLTHLISPKETHSTRTQWHKERFPNTRPARGASQGSAAVTAPGWHIAAREPGAQPTCIHSSFNNLNFQSSGFANRASRTDYHVLPDGPGGLSHNLCTAKSVNSSIGFDEARRNDHCTTSHQSLPDVLSPPQIVLSDRKVLNLISLLRK